MFLYSGNFSLHNYIVYFRVSAPLFRAKLATALIHSLSSNFKYVKILPLCSAS
jgi:hypothetical protein